MAAQRLKIPTDGIWRGVFPSEFAGNLWHASKIDLERQKGKIMVGDSFTDLIDSADDVDLGLPVAFVRTAADSTDRWWALAGAVLFKTTNTDPETGWTQDAIASTPTAAENDAIEFGDNLVVSVDTNLSRLVAGTWTASWWSGLTGAAAMTASPHRMCIFAGALLITDGRFINDYDGTTARDPALTLPADQQADWIEPAADFAFMGGQAVGGAFEAEIFHWNRATTAFESRYGSGDSQVFAGFTIYGIPHIITRKGEIKKFTGQGYRTVAKFPAADLGIVIADLHPNGIVVDKNIAKILVRFGATSGAGFGLQSLRVLDGIWTFDGDNNNLYHSGALINTVATNDYGQTEMAGVGAMIYTNPTQGRYLIGGQLYTVYTGTTRFGIFSSDEASTSNRGYFITPKIASQDVKAWFSRLIPKFRRFDASSDRLRFAYRVRDSNTLPAYETITWVTATTFTASNADVAVGDFVEILAGANAGAIAKITTIAAGTYTIDVTLNASTSTARARYLPFIDLGTISNQNLQSKILSIAARSEWIQLFVELRGTSASPQFESFILDVTPVPA